MNRKYRKTLIAGNWKMNKTPTQTKAFMTELKGLLPKGRWCDIALCVPAVCIPAAVRAMRETRVAIGAENCNAHTSGAYTGETATPEQAEEVCQHIRTIIRKRFGSKNARAMTILYGGSMNEKNAFELLAQPDIDGGLIGGASLVPEKFVRIIEDANQPVG